MIMEELLLDLEKKIKTLVNSHVHLKQANQHLQLSKSTVIGEKEALLLTQQKTVAHIEKLVSRLKAIEEGL